MKKFIAILVIGLIAVSVLTACVSKNNENEQSTDGTSCLLCG